MHVINAIPHNLSEETNTYFEGALCISSSFPAVSLASRGNFFSYRDTSRDNYGNWSDSHALKFILAQTQN